MPDIAGRPLVIAHRGASGHRPEHTIEGYRLAIEQGADVIEPDLVMTKDGVLIARHENEIGETTDVAAKFPKRRRDGMIDGRPVTGWFVEDFTLAEIRTLRARERLPFRSHDLDDRFEIPTFDEILTFVRSEERRVGRRIGIYPETKHPSHHEALGLAITDSVLGALERFGYATRDDPVWVQSFEVGNLRHARTRTPLKLIQLIDAEGGPADRPGVSYREMITPAGLREVAEYADGIGPSKALIQPIGADGSLGQPTALVEDAHRAGLVVHVWTLRADPEFLPAGYGGDPEAEVRQFRKLRVDGLFTDVPDVAVTALGR